MFDTITNGIVVAVAVVMLFNLAIVLFLVTVQMVKWLFAVLLVAGRFGDLSEEEFKRRYKP